MSAKTTARLATALLAIESVGVLALAGWQGVELVSAGEVASVPSAVALLVLTVAAAAGIGALAAGVVRGRTWGRSGGVVVQLLVLAVALGAGTGTYPHPGTALALGVPAAAGVVLLFLASRDAARADDTPRD